jgi:transposase
LIHGARSVLLRLKETQTPLGHWLNTLLGRVHPNVAVVALASKFARIAWALLRHRTDFDRRAFAGA